LHKLVECIIDNVSATHEIDEVVNELIGELVESKPNLKADCIRRD